MDNVNCMNPWDSQTIRQYGADGIYPALQANSNGGQNRQGVCYAIDHVVALEGNGARPSHMGKGFSDDGSMYTLNTIEQHSICYSVDCRNNELNGGISGTLQAHNNGGWSVNCTNPVLMENRNE